jgi:hypothetical protein
MANVKKSYLGLGKTDKTLREKEIEQAIETVNSDSIYAKDKINEQVRKAVENMTLAKE